jgi:hypothetical protein
MKQMAFSCQIQIAELVAVDIFIPDLGDLRLYCQNCMPHTYHRALFKQHLTLPHLHLHPQGRQLSQTPRQSSSLEKAPSRGLCEKSDNTIISY